MYEVETNRLVPLLTPLFFGWTIFLKDCPARLELHEGRIVCVLVSDVLQNLLYFAELEIYNAYANS